MRWILIAVFLLLFQYTFQEIIPQIYSVGNNEFGQFGDGYSGEEYKTITQIVNTNQKDVLNNCTIIQVYCSYQYTLFLDSMGKVYGTGLNNKGQIGDNTITNTNVPVATYMDQDLAGKKIVQLSGGLDHSLLLDSEGRVYGMGLSTYGQLGFTFQIFSKIPILISTEIFFQNNKIIQIAAGHQHTILLNSLGMVFTMGFNLFGQLGDGTIINRSVPTPIISDDVLLEKQIIYISGGEYHSILIDSNGKVYGMGNNNFGQLGDGTQQIKKIPVSTYSEGVLQGKKIIQSSCGNYFTLLLDEDGDVFGMGLNDNGQLGYNNSVQIYKVPVAANLDDVKGIVKQIATGSFHTLLLDNLGFVYAMGSNNYSQLGDGTLNRSWFPIISQFTNASYISTSESHSMAIVSTNCKIGELYNSSDSCIPCPEGYYCPTSFIINSCPTSQWSLEGSNSLSNCSFELCENGTKCESGTKDYCPPGKWRSGDEEECSDCDYGLACLNGTINTCVTGNLYPLGTGFGQSECGVCPESKFILRNNYNSLCLSCFIGYACPGNGELIQCIGNKYASNPGQVNCSVCENGFTHNSSVTCFPCLPSFKCIDGIYAFPCDYKKEDCNLCPIGYRAIIGPIPKCILCEEGKYCDGINEFLCPNSTTSKSGGKSLESCFSCPEGNICNEGNMTLCLNNKYSNKGAIECSICGAGNYTEKSIYNEGNSKCLFCPEGYSCDGKSLSLCLGNQYSIGKVSECSVCGAGNYTEKSLYNEGNSKCLFCPEGYSCDGKSLSLCLGNQYSIGKVSECSICGAGSYTEKSLINEGNSKCIPCPEGYYCIGDGKPIICEAGNYTNSKGSIECNRCNLIGHYTPQQRTGCDPCPTGNYCPSTDLQPLNCFSSDHSTHYSDTTGLSSCKICTKGNYISQLGVTCDICPKGYFCSDGFGFYKCFNGTQPYYNDEEGVSECKICTSGSYVTDDGLKCQKCQKGTYCPDGLNYFKCFNGTQPYYNDEEGKIKCKTCPSGSFISEEGTDCLSCPKGSYCSDGIKIEKCPGDTYTKSTGASLPKDCKQNYCPEYYNCKDGIASPMNQEEIDSINQKKIEKIIISISLAGFILLFIVILYCWIVLGFSTILGIFIYKGTNNIQRKSEIAKRLLEGFEKDAELDELDEDANRAKLMIKKSLMEINYNELKILEKIGIGGSDSIVFKAKWDKLTVAVKMYNVRRLTGDNQYELFEKELSIMSGLRHPRLVSFYGACLQYPRIGLVLEYCSGGTLSDIIEKKIIHSMTKEQILKIILQICEGMIFLHNKGVIHRDLKLDNVLLNSERDVKIADFGLARHIDSIEQVTRMTGGIGTSYYCAPEVTNQLNYDNKCDVYSFSMMMYELFSGSMNPYGNNIPQIQIQIQSSQNPSFRPDISLIEQSQFYEYAPTIIACWNADPSQRPSFNSLWDIFRID